MPYTVLYVLYEKTHYFWNSLASPSIEELKMRLTWRKQRMLRIHYMSLATGNLKLWRWPHPNDLHWIDAIRQYIMCNPVDTLFRSTGHRDVGHGQHKKCQDWAEEHSANYLDEWDMVEKFDNHRIWYLWGGWLAVVRFRWFWIGARCTQSVSDKQSASGKQSLLLDCWMPILVDVHVFS